MVDRGGAEEYSGAVMERCAAEDQRAQAGIGDGECGNCSIWIGTWDTDGSTEVDGDGMESVGIP